MDGDNIRIPASEEYDVSGRYDYYSTRILSPLGNRCRRQGWRDRGTLPTSRYDLQAGFLISSLGSVEDYGRIEQVFASD